MPDFRYEQESEGSVIGFDEAGCGPWAGPVVAGAIYLDQDRLPSALRSSLDDSKTLSSLKRDQLFHQLQDLEGQACFSAIGVASVEEIDQLNIRQAAMKAMERAAGLLRLPSHLPPITLGLVDGTLKLSLSYPSRSLVKGDSLSLSIAAASIIAKVTRDRWMQDLDQQYPEYGWAQNKGYGTAVHLKALHHYGPTAHHRHSFKPVQEALEKVKLRSV